MDQIEIKDEFIKLGQALKLAGIAESGVDAKIMIEEETVKVNGETETRRGRKLYDGDAVEARGMSFMVSSPVKK
ncbi:MAG: RNA-binding S4 domain-containing protein [Lachnospiraceae bacterium]|nr:RNA-binding S4 domain-containing protein [Bacillota bacterium]MCI6595638.1 RNA-binding S4 domain-containing protein [Bacillota bacterium]MDD7253140.1 RNA-binding S4 domain-containing protein [Bacillota bacterium]MDY2949893.1 RNA-binding S4 domain-containing protein [Lachnospiraceae bacterium]